MRLISYKKNIIQYNTKTQFEDITKFNKMDILLT